jgi:hypothetical protein
VQRWRKKDSIGRAGDIVVDRRNELRTTIMFIAGAISGNTNWKTMMLGSPNNRAGPDSG